MSGPPLATPSPRENDIEPSESPKILIGLWVVLLLALVAVGHDVVSQSDWLGGFFRSFGLWIHHPATSLRLWRPRVPPPGEIVAGVSYLGIALWSSLLLLQRSRLEGDRVALIGLTAIMGISAAGLVGTFLVTFGLISVWGLVGGTAILLGLLATLTLRVGGPRQLWRPYSSDSRSERLLPIKQTRLQIVTRWWTCCSVGVVLLLVTLRDLISPVVEWDSTVYHAELARLWFLQRPDPPLLFGPSLGVQISGNYPPLFPASGLVSEISADRVTDLTLRLASPVLLIGILLLLFSFARKRFGSQTAWLSVFLLGTTPLMVLYSSWSTSYVLTTALGFVAVVFCVEAAEQESVAYRLWICAGLLLGLAILSSFYGWLFVVVAMFAVLLRRSTWNERVRSALCVLITVGSVAGVWLIRNWVELGDPLYPLSVPLFHARGIAGPLWRAAEHELRANANSYWIGSHTLLRLRQLLTLLFDRHLLIVGSLPVILMFWRTSYNRTAMRLVGVAVVVLLGAELVPGWFWIRSLLPAVPALAIAGGVALTQLDAFSRLRRSDAPRPRSALRTLSDRTFRVATLTLFASVALIGSTVALAIVVAGPGQSTWTTQLPNTTNFMTLDQNLGSTSGTLWTVFGGDYEAWVWLNNHLGDQRLATFDIRTYYLNNPGRIFYLDGQAAKPLLDISSSNRALAFFRHQNVRYIFMPAWAVGQSATRDPAVDLLPLHKFLGDKNFPLVASFAPTPSFPLSYIYQVGGSVADVASAIDPGPSSPAPHAGGPYVFASQSTDGWIFVPLSNQAHEKLRISYFDAKGSVSFNAFVSGGTWDLDIATIKMHNSLRWRHVTISVPPSDYGITALSVTVNSGSFEVSSALAFRGQ